MNNIFSKKRIIKTCSWQLLGIVWFMSYAIVTGGDIWYIFDKQWIK